MKGGKILRKKPRCSEDRVIAGFVNGDLPGVLKVQCCLIGESVEQRLAIGGTFQFQYIIIMAYGYASNQETLHLL